MDKHSVHVLTSLKTLSNTSFFRFVLIKDPHLFKDTGWHSFRSTSRKIVFPHKRFGWIVGNWKKQDNVNIKKWINGLSVNNTFSLIT